MEIDWDPAKDSINREAHGVALSDAVKLNWGAMLIKDDGRKAYGESRYIGYAPIARRLYCVGSTVSSLPVGAKFFGSSACVRQIRARYTPMKRLKLIKPTAREDRAIAAGIKKDPDTRELSNEEFKQLRPLRGRPPSNVHKIPVTVRLDPAILEYFRDSGPGWQTRMNDALSRYVQRQKRA